MCLRQPLAEALLTRITSSAISINLRVAQAWRHLMLTHAPLLDDPTIRGCLIAAGRELPFGPTCLAGRIFLRGLWLSLGTACPIFFVTLKLARLSAAKTIVFRRSAREERTIWQRFVVFAGDCYILKELAAFVLSVASVCTVAIIVALLWQLSREDDCDRADFRTEDGRGKRLHGRRCGTAVARCSEQGRRRCAYEKERARGCAAGRSSQHRGSDHRSVARNHRRRHPHLFSHRWPLEYFGGAHNCTKAALVAPADERTRLFYKPQWCRSRTSRRTARASGREGF